MPHESCYYRVRHSRCNWSINTFDWQILANDHDRTCGAPRNPEKDWDYRVQCLTHNPDDNPAFPSRQSALPS